MKITLITNATALWLCLFAIASVSTATADSFATVNALSIATTLDSRQPTGDVEKITCRSSLVCARCHLLSQDFKDAAAQDSSWIDPATCNVKEVKEGSVSRVWIDVPNIMPETLDSIRSGVVYLRDHAPHEYQIPPGYLKLHDLSFTLSYLPLVTRGTSAGVAFLLATYSTVTGIPIMPQVAVTGSIDEKGEVGPVGGLVDKILAADSKGFTTVIIPAANQSDLALVPPEILKRVRVILATSAEQALFHAFGQAGPNGAAYQEMFEKYSSAIALQGQGDTASAVKIFSELAARFPEDYSLRVWLQYLSPK